MIRPPILAFQHAHHRLRPIDPESLGFALSPDPELFEGRDGLILVFLVAGT